MLNVKRSCIALSGTPSDSYGVSLAIWDHTVLPATRHKLIHLDLIPARQAGTRFTHPRGMERWIDRLHTKMVFPPTDSHPSRY